MSRKAFISLLFLMSVTLSLLTCPSVWAQKVGSPTNDVNALDYRYRRFSSSLPVYADSVGLRERFYVWASAGAQAHWNPGGKFASSAVHLLAGVTVGYRFTPVHGVEITPSYICDYAGGHGFGADLAYVMDINNFATRKDYFSRFRFSLIAGLGYRHVYSLEVPETGEPSYYYTSMSAAGLVTGLRMTYHPARNLGIFVEPRLFAGVSALPSGGMVVMPSLNIGVMAGFADPQRLDCTGQTTFAVKTNLLYDALGAVNAGIEVPIGSRWSVGAEWLCPWWSLYRKQYSFQLLRGSLEGRYWFGNRESRDPLTGFFAGVSLGGGVYDLMFKADEGCQGEYISAGVTGGYAHRINRSGSLRMEYSLGLGYIGSKYRKYYWDGFDYTLIAPSPQAWRTDLFAPTTLKVSLVYMLTMKTGRR